MRAVTVAGALVLCVCLTAGSSAFAGYRHGILLSPREARIYRACISGAWIEDWCRVNAGRFSGTYERLYVQCIVANRGGRVPLDGRSWPNTDDYCWTMAHYAR